MVKMSVGFEVWGRIEHKTPKQVNSEFPKLIELSKEMGEGYWADAQGDGRVVSYYHVGDVQTEYIEFEEAVKYVKDMVEFLSYEDCEVMGISLTFGGLTNKNEVMGIVLTFEGLTNKNVGQIAGVSE